MSVLRTKPNSPYIFLSFYNPETKKRTEFSLKLPQTKEGWRLAKDKQKKFDAELTLGQLSVQLNTRVNTSVLLSDGLNEFFAYKEDSDKPIRKNTVRAYVYAVRHFKTALKNRPVNQYTAKDGKRFIDYMVKRGDKQNTQGIHTRHLHALWNYFVEKGYAKTNIIKKVPQSKPNPVAIPFQEAQVILDYFQQKNMQHYHFVYFLLLTGFRVSTALAQKWEDVYFDLSVMKAYNVKAGHDFFFPIHDELKKLLKEMKPKENGRLFYYINQVSPIFWRRDIPKLLEQGLIKKRYTLHQFRKSFGSWGAQTGIESAVMQKLLDHSSEKITQTFYIEYQMNLMKERLEQVQFRKKPGK